MKTVFRSIPLILCEVRSVAKTKIGSVNLINQQGALTYGAWINNNPLTPGTKFISAINQFIIPTLLEALDVFPGNVLLSLTWLRLPGSHPAADEERC